MAAVQLQAVQAAVGAGGDFDHSVEATSGMAVHIVPALSDNYTYLLVCNKTKMAAVIDPVVNIH